MSSLKVSTNDLDQIPKVETCSNKIFEYLDLIEERQNCMNYPLNLKETQTDSLLKDKRESESNWDYSDK